MSGVCVLSSPSERGFIKSFDDQSLIFDDLFETQLCLDPSDHRILLARLPRCSRHEEMHITADLFERFNIPALVKKPDCVLSLMDSGLLTGMGVDCGDTVCHSSAVYYGEVLRHTVRTLRLGGKDVSQQLARIVRCETGFSATSRSAMDHISRIKEGLQGIRDALRRRRRSFRHSVSVDYALPDGQTISIRNESLPELYNSGEVLFEPSLIGVKGEGLSGMVMSTLTASPLALRNFLAQNVILCGGSALMTDVRERLDSEAAAYSGVSLNIRTPLRPQFSVWRGGALLSQLSTFNDMSVTRDEYFEEGALRVERKFC